MIQAEAHQAVNARGQAMSELYAAELAFALPNLAQPDSLPRKAVSRQNLIPCEVARVLRAGCSDCMPAQDMETFVPFGEPLRLVRRGDLPVQIYHGSIGWSSHPLALDCGCVMTVCRSTAVEGGCLVPKPARFNSVSRMFGTIGWSVRIRG